MVNFKLLHWTACQNCSGSNRFIFGTVENITNKSRTITVLAADSNSNDVGSKNITIDAYDTQYFLISTSLPVDYSQRVYCVGWEGSNLQFNKHKNSLYFDVEDGCKSPGTPTNISAQCRQDGGCRIEWSAPSDGDIYVYVINRYKNNVLETSFETTNTYFVDNTIVNCNGTYSYQVYSVDKCVNDSPYSSLIEAIPYEEPCIPDWRCRQPLDGYETDVNQCGESDRYNENCEPGACVPDWHCEVDIDGKNTGWKIDLNNCFERTYDSITCPPGQEPPEPSNILFYAVIGGLGLVGLKLLNKKQ